MVWRSYVTWSEGEERSRAGGDMVVGMMAGMVWHEVCRALLGSTFAWWWSVRWVKSK